MQIELHFNIIHKTPVFVPVCRVLGMCVSLQQRSNKKLIILQKLCDHLASAALQSSDSVEQAIFRERNCGAIQKILSKVVPIIQQR